MAFLKSAIEQLDPAPDKKKEITLALQVLFELAEQRTVLFKNELETSLRTAGTTDNPTVPISSILAWHRETSAYVKDDAGKLPTVLGDALKQFIGGKPNDIVDGAVSLATAAIEAILGSGAGVQTEMRAYYIIVEGLSIVRVDLAAWSRQIEATGITTKIENAMAFQAAKSSVNVDRITFNTFLQAYKGQLEKLDLPADELLKFIRQAKEVFELLRDPTAPALSGAVHTASARQPGEVVMLSTP